MAKKADTMLFSPTDTDTTREAMFYPLFNDQYWTAAEKHFNETGDELFNLRSALDTTRSHFFDGADGVTADDVRRLELEVERAERQYEVAEEPVAWLKQRRDRDAESVRRSGMPSGLAEKKNRLRRIDEQIAYARSTERLQRLQNDRDLTARRVADLERRYNDAVRLLRTTSPGRRSRRPRDRQRPTNWRSRRTRGSPRRRRRSRRSPTATTSTFRS